MPEHTTLTRVFRLQTWQKFLEGAGYGIELLFATLYWCKAAWRKRDEIAYQMYRMAFNSIPVIFPITLFSGMILALQTGVELRAYGREESIGSIVPASMCREMGPVMAAFALASLIGSTIAAEIATMKVSEELDALEVMSINPIYFLVMPRFVALALVAPLLTIYADLIGILGGSLVGYYIFDISFSTYKQNTIDVLELRDIYSGLVKALIFGVTIAMVASSQGLRAENGAAGVGRATLRSVVISMVLVLMFSYFITTVVYK